MRYYILQYIFGHTVSLQMRNSTELDSGVAIVGDSSGPIDGCSLRSGAYLIEKEGVVGKAKLFLHTSDFHGLRKS